MSEITRDKKMMSFVKKTSELESFINDKLTPHEI